VNIIEYEYILTGTDTEFEYYTLVKAWEINSGEKYTPNPNPNPNPNDIVLSGEKCNDLVLSANNSKQEGSGESVGPKRTGILFFCTFTVFWLFNLWPVLLYL
jgi:hypothetical protein